MRIALLWHMHQPDYRHPDTHYEEMPWTRLHALKNYLDMARLVEEAPPAIRVTFNLTPALMEQLAQMASQGPRDPFYRLARKAPVQLTPADKAFLLANFFSANEERLIQTQRGYADLHRKAGGGTAQPSRSTESWSDQDWLDLQVCFHLAWCGRTLREEDLVRHLLARGRPYKEGEKHALLDLQDRFLGRILPYYRKLWETGRIEISTTPLNHPILPLLCDLRAAREGDPTCPVDGLDFRFPDDARDQVIRGRAAAERILGQVPQGMWPSEGSVSEPVVRILETAGVRWIATDQQILARSLAAANVQTPFPAHLRPWRLRGTVGPAIFFRDTPLSDRIGFTYSRWPAEEAVQDFVARARATVAADPDPAHACLPIILDGENAWEFYEDMGTPFLSALYRALDDAPDIQLVTCSEAVEATPVHTLPRLKAGSWIFANLNTWIGHTEKNRAWELLGETRREFQDQLGHRPPEVMEEARRHLFKAESSDWFWWLGDDHPSPNKYSFEELFRRNLRAVWRVLGRTPPAGLSRPIPEPRALPRVESAPPFALIHPNIDGEDVPYFEWIGAGTLEIGPQSGAIFTGAPLFRRLQYGFDLTRFYVRLTPVEGRAEHLLRDAQLRIHLRTGTDQQAMRVQADPSGALVLHPSPADPPTPLGSWAVGRLFEAGLSLEPLGLGSRDTFSFYLEVLLPDGPAERVPKDGALTCVVPPPHFDQLHWSV